MASILSLNNSTNQQIPPKQAIESAIQQILNSPESQQEFTKLIGTNPEAQNVMNIVRQYGNGDLRAGFMNYATAMGKTEAVAHKGTACGEEFRKMSEMEVWHANALLKMFNNKERPTHMTEADYASTLKSIMDKYSTSMTTLENMKRVYWG